MRRFTIVTPLLFAVSFVAVAQKDWRQMERRKLINQVSSMQLKNGLNEVTKDPKGFTLFAVAKDSKITDWQAKDARKRKLNITRYEHPATADDSKDPSFKVLTVCVEAKDVCFDVQLVRASG